MKSTLFNHSKAPYLVVCLLLIALHMTSALNASAHAKEIISIMWDDLIPKDFVMPNPLAELSDDEYAELTDDSDMAQALQKEMQLLRESAPVVEALDGKTVRLPGFVVPLDFDAKQVHKFLLVPYFGACIHTPPPPSNQIVYVESDQGIDSEKIWDPVYVTGELKASRVTNELASAGYSMHAGEILPYE